MIWIIIDVIKIYSHREEKEDEEDVKETLKRKKKKHASPSAHPREQSRSMSPSRNKYHKRDREAASKRFFFYPFFFFFFFFVVFNHFFKDWLLVIWNVNLLNLSCYKYVNLIKANWCIIFMNVKVYNHTLSDLNIQTYEWNIGSIVWQTTTNHARKSNHFFLSWPLPFLLSVMNEWSGYLYTAFHQVSDPISKWFTVHTTD